MSQVSYSGFSYGIPAYEMSRPLELGNSVLNMGGVTLVIPDTVNVDKCGQTNIIYKADTGTGEASVVERFETNNLFVSTIFLHCLNGKPTTHKWLV